MKNFEFRKSLRLLTLTAIIGLAALGSNPALALDEECGGCRYTLMSPIQNDDSGSETVSDCKDPATITCTVNYDDDYYVPPSTSGSTTSGGSTQY